jgi:hypothetical protein
MKNQKHLLICFIVIASIAKQAQAQTPYVAIPDSNFVHYLKTIVPTAFKGDSLNTNSALVTTTTHSINCSSLSISNLTGVQYFTSLTYLVCVDNSLTTLPPLPNSLMELWCGSNSLLSLPVLPNSFQVLSCYYNRLISLPALPNSLRYLDCSYNYITCFSTFPDSMPLPRWGQNALNYSIYIDPNLYNCLPNHVAAMSPTDSATPLCAAGNTNGCAVAGIEQYNINNEVKVYPNPASSIINVSLLQAQGANCTLMITDMLGNTVKQSIIYNLTSIIDVSTLSEGVYNISIAGEEGTINKKVVLVR